MKRLFLFLSLALLLSSCANKSMTRYEELSEPLEKGGFEAGIKAVVENQEDLYGSNTEFLYYFDLGTLYHYSGAWAQSAQNFEKAAQVYDDLFARSVSNEAAAIVTNDNVRPYRARPFELLALYEMNIVNYIAQNDVDGAMVEVKRAQIAMEALYQKSNKDVNDAGYLRYLSAIVYEMAGEKDDAAISYFKTVQAYEEDPVALPSEAWEFITAYLREQGRDEDLKELKKTAPADASKAKAVREKGSEIIVLGYAGHSAILGEWMLSGTYVKGGVLNLTGKSAKTGKIESMTLPAPAISTSANAGTTVSVTIALPERKDLNYQVKKFDIKVDGAPAIFKPEVVADVTENLDRNIEQEKTTTVTRTIVRVATRTIAAQEAKKAMRTDNLLINLATNIGTDIAAAQLEQADLRVGLFLPKNIQMTRIPVTPGSHQVNVLAIDKNGSAVKNYEYKVNVRAGEKAWVVVPAIK
ncbi:MAG: hypothetical protein WCX75_05250 [Fibrobacteraceae bacterium]